MYIHLYRNAPQGSAITGRLVIDGRWFCNTLERVGYQIPALCYHVAVTHSPKFKRLLPIVQNVPRPPIGDTPSHSAASHSPQSGRPIGGTPSHSAASHSPQSGRPIGGTPSHRARPVQYPSAECRTGIRFHRGSKPEHSTGCILVVADNPVLPAAGAQPLADQAASRRSVATGRSTAEVEKTLTSLILKAQHAHEEIILEVTDFHPGTPRGYNTPCPPELQRP